MKNKIPKKIVFLSAPSFPFGQASSNRILTLARGIITNHYKCDVICTSSSFWPTNPDGNNKYCRKGIFNDIRYTYTCPIIRTPNCPPLKKLNTFIGFINSIVFVLLKYNKNNTSCLVISHLGSKYLFTYGIISKILHIKLLLLRSEYPEFKIRKTWYSRFYERSLFRYLLIHFIDGGLFMTDILMEYFNYLTKNSFPTTIIPLTIEVEKYNNNDLSQNNNNNLVIYSGSLSDAKEGISNLLEAFALILKSNPLIKLHLYGKQNSTNAAKYKMIIKEYKLEDNVCFKGFIHSNDIPSVISEASVLILPRPNNIQAEGGFPTKLGEYLSTGIPVIVTRTGEIDKYLKHKIHCFLLDSNAPHLIKSAILEVFTDYNAALSIGDEGRRVAKSLFDSEQNSKKIIQFVESLID